jgi:hypothetical protein
VSVRKPQLLATFSIGLTVGLLASGCGDKDITTPTPSSSATSNSSTPSVTPSIATPTGPTLPAAAKGITVTSADAFARFYLAAIDHAAGTGNVSLLKEWADKGCVSCNALIQHYSSVYKAGGSLSGDFRSRDAKTVSARLNGTKAADVSLRFIEGRHTIVPRKGASPTVYPGGPSEWRMALLNQGGKWVMYEMEEK